MTRYSLLGLALLCFLPFRPSIVQGDEPTTARGFYERGLVHEIKKRYAEALADYSEAIKLDPQFIDAWFTRSSLYAGHPSFEQRDYAKAVADLTKILEIEPKRFSARFNRALYYESLREFDRAIADYSWVIDGDTDFSLFGDGRQNGLAHAYHYRGRAYHWYKKDYIKAVADYSAALGLDSTKELGHYHRGQAYQMLKEYGKAQDDFAVAIQRDPDYPNLLNIWAWQLATCPDAKYRDGPKAVAYASKANEKSRGNRPELIDTLAAAHAESGDFDEAVKWQKKAIDLLGPKADEQRKDMQVRLKLYETGKPFRSE